MSEKKVPEVRFKGFSDQWEKNLFGNCVLIQRGGSPRPIESFMTNDENGINWIKIGDVSVGSRYITKTTEKIIPEGEKYSRKVYKGDLILSNSMSFGRPFIMDVDGCIHDGWLLIRDEQKKYNVEYLQQMLSSTHMLMQYKSLASGGVVNNLNSELVQSATICYPKINEQTKIGKFFKNLDNLIAQNQKKYDKLVNMKNACLDKMFPKDGVDTPEVRFKGFGGEWEKKELGTLYKKIRNAFVGTATPFYVENGNFYLESNNVKNGQINKNSQVFINDEFYLKQKDNWLHTGDLVVVQSGHVGHCAVIPPELDNTAAHALIIISISTGNTEPHFVNYQFLNSSTRNNIANITTGNTIKHILSSGMKTFNIYVADMQEQAKIGTFFQNLDHLITLQKTKLEKFKNIKKACLDKMFI